MQEEVNIIYAATSARIVMIAGYCWEMPLIEVLPNAIFVGFTSGDSDQAYYVTETPEPPIPTAKPSSPDRGWDYHDGDGWYVSCIEANPDDHSVVFAGKSNY